MDKVIRTKLSRVQDSNKPRVLDLFSGCGGLSLGFQRAGCAIVGAVEFDPLAAQSHGNNFFRHEPEHQRALHSLPRDITKTPPQKLMKELGLTPPETQVDIIIGGPPCQAFARIGRAKLREVMDHPEAFKKDQRADLYQYFLQYIKALRPFAVVMENVPDILNYGGVNLPEQIAETLETLGYACGYGILNSANYGVPQFRDRVFIVGIWSELGLAPSLPAPTHWVELPAGYGNSRKVALKYAGKGLAGSGHLLHTDEPTPALASAVTASEALGDLPPISDHLTGKMGRGARRFTDEVRYAEGRAPSAYARLMREWPGFETTGVILDHVIRYLPRDYSIFRRMKAGDEYPAAHELAMRMLEEEMRRISRRTGRAIKEGSSEYRKLKAQIVPPYDPGKFPNKWGKMTAGMPARTLTAHIGKDTYSHIHFDSAQARTISVREAARLHSFPDGFTFAGTMNPAFRQIGNAVTPLLSNAIAAHTLERIFGAGHAAAGSPDAAQVELKSGLEDARVATG